MLDIAKVEPDVMIIEAEQAYCSTLAFMALLVPNSGSDFWTLKANQAKDEYLSLSHVVGDTIFTQIGTKFEKALQKHHGEYAYEVFRVMCGISNDSSIPGHKTPYNRARNVVARNARVSIGTVNNAWKDYKNSAHLWAGFYEVLKQRNIETIPELREQGFDFVDWQIKSKQFLDFARMREIEFHNWDPVEIDIHPDVVKRRSALISRKDFNDLLANGLEVRAFLPSITDQEKQFALEWKPDDRTQKQKKARRKKRTLRLPAGVNRTFF